MLKQNLLEALENPESRYFRLANDTLAILTLLSVAATILETVESLRFFTLIFLIIEIVSVSLFATEYVARIYVAEKKLDYIFSVFGIIDLLSVLPSVLAGLNLTFLKTARILRILRLFRIIRLAKLARMQKDKIQRGVDDSRLYLLNLEIYMLSMLATVVIFGALMYALEGYRPEFANVPLSMIWSFKITMGGVPAAMPDTTLGELVLLANRFSGLLLLALLVHVVGSTIAKLIFGTDLRNGEASLNR